MNSDVLSTPETIPNFSARYLHTSYISNNICIPLVHEVHAQYLTSVRCLGCKHADVYKYKRHFRCRMSHSAIIKRTWVPQNYIKFLNNLHKKSHKVHKISGYISWTCAKLRIGVNSANSNENRIAMLETINQNSTKTCTFLTSKGLFKTYTVYNR